MAVDRKIARWPRRNFSGTGSSAIYPRRPLLTGSASSRSRFARLGSRILRGLFHTLSFLTTGDRPFPTTTPTTPPLLPHRVAAIPRDAAVFAFDPSEELGNPSPVERRKVPNPRRDVSAHSFDLDSPEPWRRHHGEEAEAVQGHPALPRREGVASSLPVGPMSPPPPPAPAALWCSFASSTPGKELSRDAPASARRPPVPPTIEGTRTWKGFPRARA